MPLKIKSNALQAPGQDETEELETFSVGSDAADGEDGFDGDDEPNRRMAYRYLVLAILVQCCKMKGP